MKKVISVLSLLFCTIIASANIDVNTSNNVVYLQDAKVQVGSSATLKVMLKSENAIGSVKVIFSLPEGVTIDGKPVSEGANVTWNADENILVLGKGDPYYTTGEIATFKVNVASDVTVGAKDIKVTYYSITEPSLATYTNEDEEVVSTLIAQKTAVIEPQSDDVQFDILPEIVSAGAADLKVLLKNQLDVASFTLTVTYPEGVTPKSGRGSAPTVIKDNLYSSTDASVTALSIANTVNGQVATYTVSNAALDTYMAKNEYYTAFTLPVTISGADALYNITAEISNIVAYDAANDANLVNPISIPGGGFATSLFLGTPKETDPILYGHYTEDIISTLNDGVAKNFCTVDMTAATVDNGLTINDALVYTPEGNTTYYRAVKEGSTYGTAVLPIASEATYYTYKGVEDGCIVFEEAENNNVPVNTPVLFSGEISGSGDGIVTPSKDVVLGTNGATDASLTFQGTYETTYLNPDTGYYIAKDAFYSDGANVKAFRGYFTGNFEAKSLRIAISDATGIHDITDQLSAEDIYNLQGIRQQTAKKGINIIGGKKVYKK